MFNSFIRRLVAGYALRFSLGVGLVLAAALGCSALPVPQSEDNTPSTMVPPPDPGYSLYYHDSEGNPDFADRWGYHDGWTEGRHDRNHGDTLNPEDKEHYKIPPDHGGHPGVTRDQYVKNYRGAYQRGYQHGNRI
jgi:hypothetical protein